MRSFLAWWRDIFTPPATRWQLAAILRNQGVMMSALTQLATDLVAVTQKVAKIGGETQLLLTRIAELQAALENSGNTTPEVDAALSALQQQVAVVDALVPDAPPAPAPEPAPAPAPDTPE